MASRAQAPLFQIAKDFGVSDIDMGFRHLVFHAHGLDHARFIAGCERDVLPRLRARAQAAGVDISPG